jgi:phosphatidylglycerophosphate synthase
VIAQRFSLRHAYANLLGLGLFWITASTLPIPLLAIASLAYWVWEERESFATPSGFGAANSVTALRAVSLLPLAAAADAGAPALVALWTFAIFTLDGIDGWLARRASNTTAFGARFDAETDASLMLLLSAAAVALERAWAWAVIAGMLRFVWVLTLAWSQRVEVGTPRTRIGRYAFSIAVTSFTACFWPPQLAPLSHALAAVATLVLCYSFSLSFRALFAAAHGCKVP